MVKRALMAIAAVFIGAATLSAVTTTATAAAPLGSFDGATPVLNCAHDPATMPSNITIYCGDGNGGFTDITWHLWTDQVAVGTANKFWVECDPACYNGTLHKEPVWIALHDVEPTDRGLAFHTVTAVDPSGPHDVTLPGFPFIGPVDFP